MINDILWDMLGQFVLAYIDDIHIYSTTPSDVRLVLSWLLEHQLYAKAKLCLFHQFTVSFLGYVIGPDGEK